MFSVLEIQHFRNFARLETQKTNHGFTTQYMVAAVGLPSFASSSEKTPFQVIDHLARIVLHYVSPARSFLSKSLLEATEIQFQILRLLKQFVNV